MRIAYLDTFSGISGDMTLGAFLDLGVPLAALEAGLEPLGLAGVRLEVGRRVRSGIAATKLTVHLGGPADTRPENPAHDHLRDPAHDDLTDPDHRHPHDLTHDDRHPRARATAHASRPEGTAAQAHGPHRRWREIRDLLERAALAPGVRTRALAVFRALAVAEGKVHGIAPDDVWFHEVGAVDAIVDIVGAAVCLEHCGVEEVYAAPLPLGSGFARSQHGVIPVPPPATVELLRGFAVRAEDGSAELVTPTGAALVAALARPGPPPVFRPTAVGYGAGERELPDRPNLLRVVLGDRDATVGRSPLGPFGKGASPERDEMVVLEANIDDMNPELYEAAVEALFAAGARDVTLAPVTMKKGRPGVLLQVIAEPDDRDRLGVIVLRETSTIGVRSYPVTRLTLPRTRRTVATAYGAIDVKLVTLPDGSTRATPEYGDCRRAAREHELPVATVYQAALRAAGEQT